MKTCARQITMFAGGGITHLSGGIGTFIQYLRHEWATKPDAPQIRVIDTRGEGGKLSMALHFPRAIGQLLVLGALRRIDLVHIHMSAYGSAVRKCLLILLATVLGVPVIVHMHGSNFREFFFGLSKPGRKALRFILNRARYVIVLGEAWRDFVISDIGVAPEKLTLIFNGVPGPADRTKPTSPSDDPLHIVFLGNIGERKGIPDLLAAFQNPRLLSKSWTATVAGDGEVDEFRAAVAKANLQERVAVPGWLDRNATSNLLRRADIFVLPSHFEAMPIAILEALAYEVPVITTPVGAIPEFLTNGQNAILVPPGARDELAAAICRLLDDPNERRRLGAAGHSVFRERFDISVAADRILTLYQSAMHPTSTSHAGGARLNGAVTAE